MGHIRAEGSCKIHLSLGEVFLEVQKPSHMGKEWMSWLEQSCRARGGSHRRRGGCTSWIIPCPLQAEDNCKQAFSVHIWEELCSHRPQKQVHGRSSKEYCLLSRLDHLPCCLPSLLLGQWAVFLTCCERGCFVVLPRAPSLSHWLISPCTIV